IFYKLWLNRDKLNITISLRSYLYKTVRNSALNYNRDKKGFSIISLDSDALEDMSQTPLEKLDQKEILTLLQLSIEKLPEKCRQIFIMNRYDGLKYRQIAEILDVSVNTVETQMGRAFKKLRKQLISFLSILTG
ncbi:sigma-70 family RNA polymerase sigma factor, partial [candidate division KSB1 bacterium]